MQEQTPGHLRRCWPGQCWGRPPSSTSDLSSYTLHSIHTEPFMASQSHLHLYLHNVVPFPCLPLPWSPGKHLLILWKSKPLSSLNSTLSPTALSPVYNSIFNIQHVTSQRCVCTSFLYEIGSIWGQGLCLSQPLFYYRAWSTGSVCQYSFVKGVEEMVDDPT